MQKINGLNETKTTIDKKKFGYSENALTSKIGFYIDAINDELTEVKLTIYEGYTQKTAAWASSYGQHQANKESIVQDPTIYQTWFYNLRTEIERRKAIR